VAQIELSALTPMPLAPHEALMQLTAMLV